MKFSQSILFSIAVHGGVLAVGAWTFTEPAHYGIQVGESSMEVNLIAAAPALESSPTVTPPEPSIPPITPPPEPEAMVEEVIPESPVISHKSEVVKPESMPALEPSPVVSTPKPTPTTPERGDGSSKKPGKDQTTAHSDSGAVFVEKPDYLRNPPPLYPESARHRKAEGKVRLHVFIDEKGNPSRVEVIDSSGHADLDAAAVKAVLRWKFRPSQAAGISIRSEAHIPIRFDLQ